MTRLNEPRVEFLVRLLRRKAEQQAREAVGRALEAERQRQEMQADIPIREKYNMTKDEYVSEKPLRVREKPEEKEAKRIVEAAGESGPEQSALPRVLKAALWAGFC